MYQETAIRLLAFLLFLSVCYGVFFVIYTIYEIVKYYRSNRKDGK